MANGSAIITQELLPAMQLVCSYSARLWLIDI